MKMTITTMIITIIMNMARVYEKNYRMLTIKNHDLKILKNRVPGGASTLRFPRYVTISPLRYDF